MNANELADAMEIRASIRRQATSRKSVQENANDRLADQLDEAATMLRQQAEQIENLKQWERRHLDVIEKQQAEIEALKQSKLKDDNKVNFELTDEEIERVRVAIMNTAYWCADENMPEAYNAVKVCCSEVLEILRKAQEK